MSAISVFPFDAVFLENDIISFVEHDFWGQSPIKVRPKYVPYEKYPHPFRGHFWNFNGKNYGRLSSSQAVSEYVQNNLDLFSRDSLVNEDVITRVISARLSKNDFLRYSVDIKRCSQIRKATLELCQHLIRGGVKEDNIGVTGSVLLKGEIEGFSDFDLVLYGAETIFKAHELLYEYAHKPQSPLQYRNEIESLEFYKKYDVQSELSANDFAVAFSQKLSQGIMYDIPFSIFQVMTPNEDRVFKQLAPNQKESPTKNAECFLAEIVDDRLSRFTFKSLYKIKKPGQQKTCILVCTDRACMEQGKIGDTIEVRAYQTTDDIYYVYQNDGYIKQI